uniref:Uncharacterized protein n=1 Tax=viral metagenome TaxID=1070528 RepID=A0A6C0E963_9ZZZZ
MNRQGWSSRLPYDDCETNRRYEESKGPGMYQMFEPKFENCNRCKVEKLYKRYDAEIVDAESDLKNIIRRASKCPENQYNPKCKKSQYCTSTFDSSNPVILAPEVCPIVQNNLKRYNTKGFKDPELLNC